jgi:L-ascorbate metabolism protein UlaG (beta-lactamase superfamily)
MGPDDALRAVKLLQPKHVVPIHYSTWDLINQDAPAWAKRVTAETGIPVHPIEPGQTFELS